ncbi:hypothetical protein AB0G74_25030 [Streptomyces sp. NPDC020875]|uniref:hypothetical protein n=1 Tax=Streptomyces sp. NPDC020875 TaxID=3154898 RepID=UPI0033F26885
MRSLTRRGPATGTVAVLAALALALTGCGTDGGKEKVASAPSAKGAAGKDGGADGKGDGAVPADNEEKARKFAECLRENGLDAPDPEDGGIRIGAEGVSKEKAEKAMKACRKYQPQGMADGKKPDPKMAESMRKFAQCMRTNGVEEFPDPRSGGGIQIDGRITEDPDFKGAEEKCRGEMPKGAGKQELNG